MKKEVGAKFKNFKSMSCQYLKEKLERIKKQTEPLEKLFKEFFETGEEEIFMEFGEKEKEVKEKVEEFKQEFKQKALLLIERFVEKRENKDDEIKILFDEKDWRFIIDGDLNFNNRESLNDFPGLIKEVKGYLDAKNAQSLNLPNLENVGEYLNAENAQVLELPNLENVGRSLWANKATSLNLPNLKNVGGSLHANKATSLNLPNLEDVGGDLDAENAQSLDLAKIKNIGQNIYIFQDNPKKEELIRKAKEWREKGILKGKIEIGKCDEERSWCKVQEL